MDLFEKKTFKMHSGDIGHWKIECDALTDSDIETLAFMIAERFVFSHVIGIPRGGIRIADALEKYKSEEGPVLIVDDVLTTGNSMEEARFDIPNYTDIIGVVLFARQKPVDWIYPMFQLWGRQQGE